MGTLRSWTQDELNLLKEKWECSTKDEMILLFPGKKYGSIKSKAANLRLRKDAEHSRFIFSEENKQYMIEHYHDTKGEDLAQLFGCDVLTIYRNAFAMGLKKDREFMVELARKNMENPDHPARKFWNRKGCVAFNKGLKQSDFMSPEAIERTKATRFKPGQKIWNESPIDTEVITEDGYIKVKIAHPNKWRWKQRIVWEENFGEIPKGYNVQFKDGIKTNVDPGNLYLISRADQLRNENTFLRYPDEIKEIIRTLGKLNKQIEKYETD